MAIALVAQAGAGSTNGNNVTTVAVDTTGANLIVASVTDYTTPAVLSDSNGNTWTALARSGSASSPFTRLYYCDSPIVGAGHTFTASASGSVPTINVVAFSGALGASSYDSPNQNGATTGSNVTSIQPGSSGTPSVDGCVIVTACSVQTLNTLAINSSFTIANQIGFVAAQRFGAGIAYLIQTTAAAVNPTWSWSNPNTTATRIAVFKPAPSGFGALLSHTRNRLVA
jgi:hypothetical protein